MLSKFCSKKMLNPSVLQMNEFHTPNGNQSIESKQENSDFIIDNVAKKRNEKVECQQETDVTPVDTASDVPDPDPNNYKATFAKYFTHDDMIKLTVIVSDLPYKAEKWYTVIYDKLSIKEVGELGDAYWRGKNFLMTLKYYTEAAFLCIEQKKNSNEFYRKLYGIRNYFDDFPDLKEEIHYYLYSIDKYENNGSRKKLKEYYPFIKSSYEGITKVIDLVDLSAAIAADPHLAPVFPNSPPEIKDFISLFFNWIYKNNLGKFFSNQYSIPSFSDTVYMRAYERLLWVFKAKLLNAITGTSIGDGHLLLKMAYAIQKSNECLASEFAKKAATVYKEYGSPRKIQLVESFIRNSISMNEFKDFILEKPKKPRYKFIDQLMKVFK